MRKQLEGLKHHPADLYPSGRSAAHCGIFADEADHFNLTTRHIFTTERARAARQRRDRLPHLLGLRRWAQDVGEASAGVVHSRI